LEVKAREAGVTEGDMVSNNGSAVSGQNGVAKKVNNVVGAISQREKLLKEKRIQECNLISIKKKATMD
jgi:hypothetical protein